MFRRVKLFLLAAALPLLLGLATPAEPLLIFCAASLTAPMEDICEGFRRDRGFECRVVPGASGSLARQIEAGAPAALFASADPAWLDRLDELGLLEPGTRREPLGNRLVLVGAPPAFPLAELPERLGEEGRLALGDPASVPAGAYAEEALKTLGLWDKIESRLAPVQDVRSVLALMESGAAPFGVVYATDAALAPGLAVLAEFPAESHRPIRYAFAIPAGRAKPAERTLLDYAAGPEGMVVFERYSFEVVK